MYGIQKVGFNQNYVTFGLRAKTPKLNLEQFKTILQKKFVETESTIIDLYAKISEASRQNKNVMELKDRLKVYTELSEKLKSQLKRLNESNEFSPREFYKVVTDAERSLFKSENYYINLRNKRAEELSIVDKIRRILY